MPLVKKRPAARVLPGLMIVPIDIIARMVARIDRPAAAIVQDDADRLPDQAHRPLQK